MQSDTTKLGYGDFKVLLCLSEKGGWTAGQIARQMGHRNVRSHAQIIRHALIRMQALGWVGKLDDNQSVAWVRTKAGTEAMSA